MEALQFEEKETASIVQTENVEHNLQVSSIFREQIGKVFFGDLEDVYHFSSLQNLQGTTILILTGETKNNSEEDYEVGYYNDNFDIVAKVPFKKSFKVKAKIRSVSKLKPKVNIDSDELNNAF